MEHVNPVIDPRVHVVKAEEMLRATKRNTAARLMCSDCRENHNPTMHGPLASVSIKIIIIIYDTKEGELLGSLSADTTS